MNKFNEYQFLYGRAEKLSERRQTTSQIYLTINTAIFGAITFLIQDSSLDKSFLVWGTFLMVAVGIVFCIIWLNIMVRLEKVLGWQYKYLCEMETRMPECEQLFTKERNALYTQAKKAKKYSFSLLEAWLPAVLIFVYILCFIGVYIIVHTGKI